jgi:hypothetical protein
MGGGGLTHSTFWCVSISLRATQLRCFTFFCTRNSRNCGADIWTRFSCSRRPLLHRRTHSQSARIPPARWPDGQLRTSLRAPFVPPLVIMCRSLPSKSDCRQMKRLRYTQSKDKGYGCPPKTAQRASFQPLAVAPLVSELRCDLAL